MSSVEHKLPEGWTDTILGKVAQPSKTKAEPPFVANIKYISLKHIESNTTNIIGYDYADDIKSTKAVFKKGDVLYGKLRPYLNKVCTPNFDGVCSTEIIVFSQSHFLNSIFLKYYLSTPSLVSFASQSMSGIQLPRTSYAKLSVFDFCLPPLAEQKRIVDVIEKLFVRVNKAKKQLDNTAETMKRFRKSVLKAACTGKLTEAWRGINHRSIEWKLTTLRKLGDLYCGQSPSRSDVNKNGKGTPYITGPEQWNGKEITLNKWTTNPKRLVPKDSIFITVKGSGVGKVFPGVEGSIGRDIYAFLPSSELLKEFTIYYLRHFSNDIISKSKGLIPGLTKEHILSCEILLPPQEEQKEIVCQVEEMFELADKIDDRVTDVKDRVEKLTQSILAKAFRGKLVPTEAELARIEGRDYETAKKLLGRIANIKVDEASDKEKKQMKRQLSGNQKKNTNRRSLKDVINENPKGITPENLLREANYTIEEIDDFYSDLSKIMQEIEEVKPSGSQAKKWPKNNKVLIKTKKV